MRSDRRAFLKTATRLGAAVGLGSLTRLSFGDGEPAGAKPRGTLICIFLRGGCDALNMVVPYYDDRYYEVRPTIAIARQDQGTERGVIPLNDMFGLHPAMEPLYPFYEAGTFAPLISIGSPHPSRSHFDCQDFLEYAMPGGRGITSGWLNRYLVETKVDGESDFRAVALQGLLPRALRGRYPVLAVPDLDQQNDPLDIFDDVYNDMDSMETLERGGTRDVILESGRNAIDATRRYREMTQVAPADEAGYPDGRLAARLRKIARIIKSDAGLEAACLDYGGWDQHIQEGGSTGKMADMLADVTGSIAAFANDLGEHMQNVLVLTMSEFGRTVKENGNRGTDHGHGCCMLALGGSVKGGRIHGSWGGLEKENLYDRRDLPVYTDYRLVMHEVLEKLYGCPVPEDFFPQYRVPVKERLEFLRPLA